MLGPRPPGDFAGNGVGVAGTHRLLRAILWFARDLDLDRTVARYHDWGYTVGGTEQDRIQIDEFAWLNTRRQVRNVWTGRKRIKRLLFGRLLPWALLRVVRDVGWVAFNYRDGRR